jgi:predicted transcriptional regulator
MLDKKSLSVLKVLNKLTDGTAYKVTTSDEIISMLTQKAQYDNDSIRQIMDFLEKQEYLTIKFSEENTYCYSLLPKAHIVIEQESSKPKAKKSNLTAMQYVLVAISAFVGTMLALLIFFYANFK